MKTSSNWVKWFVVVLLLAGGGGAFYWYRIRSKDAPVDFKTATLARGDIVQTVTANGIITPVKNVQVGSQISGIIQEVKADFNDRVKAGQVVAQIDPATYQQSVDQAQADLLNSQAALELAQISFKRAESLKTNQLIALSDYDNALAGLHQAEAVVHMREAALKKCKVDLERTTIYAPIDGVVITRNVDVGQTVAASFSTPTLFQIANDLAKMEIDAMVSEADVGGVLEGQNATFTVDAFPNRQFQGIIQQVRFAPTTNQNVVTYTTVVGVDNKDLKLRPGMTANLSIITAQKTNVIKLPNAAMRYRPPETATLKVPTNTVAIDKSPSAPAGSNTLAAAGDAGGALPDFSGLSREERRRRMESLPPEQQAAIHERMRARFAEGGGGNGGGSGGAPKPKDGPGLRTIYLLVKTNSPSGKELQLAKAVTVKAGISDGAFTEVIDGLAENDVVITGQTSPTPQTAARPAAGSPFGGPGGGIRLR